MKRVTIDMVENHSPESATFTMRLKDEEGNILSDAEIFSLWEKLEIIGIYLKSQWPEPNDFQEHGYPRGGIITDVDENNIFVNGMAVPKKDAHRLYQLD